MILLKDIRFHLGLHIIEIDKFHSLELILNSQGRKELYITRRRVTRNRTERVLHILIFIPIKMFEQGE